MSGADKSFLPDDVTRVDVNRENDLLYWTKQFAISAATLRQAVRLAGSKCTDVARFVRTGTLPEYQRRCTHGSCR